jgi:nicotinamide-nucleotide adenylyltransferase
MKKVGSIGCIGRWKPPHFGSKVLLESICKSSYKAMIGIGSSNKYNARNPFTAEESKEMIERMLSPASHNYELILVPDFAPQYTDGQRWVDYVAVHFGKVDMFVTGNPYVASLLKRTYNIVNPFEILPAEEIVHVKATMIRLAMAKGERWEEWVPASVCQYIKERELDERLRAEFGPEIISSASLLFKFESQLEETVNTYLP